jgi:hypothetical protein
MRLTAFAVVALRMLFHPNCRRHFSHDGACPCGPSCSRRAPSDGAIRVQLGLVAQTAYRGLNLAGRYTCAVSVQGCRSWLERDVDAADAIDFAEFALYAGSAAAAGHSLNGESESLHCWLSVGFCASPWLWPA